MATRADVEKILLSRASKRMALVGMDITTNDGSNADLGDPIGTALRKMGLNPSIPPTTGEVAAVGADDLDELLDRSELRLLENILGNWDMANRSIGPRSESYGALAGSVESYMQYLSGKIQANYGGANQLKGGTISLDFQSKGDDTIV